MRMSRELSSGARAWAEDSMAEPQTEGSAKGSTGPDRIGLELLRAESLDENRRNIPGTVEDSDDLEWTFLRVVNDQVI
jgi:hypothetical protein